MPKLTIGIPVYNGAITLEETLDSCLKISPEDVDIIISDNGSTDTTYEIAESYAKRHSQIKLVRHKQNYGAAFNFKFLLDSSKTEYFMWLAADDVIESINLSNIEKLFLNYPNSMAISPVAFVDQVGVRVPDSGNKSLNKSIGLNTLQFLIRPGANSRFYSIYKTYQLRNLYFKILGKGQNDYYSADTVFSLGVLQQGEWPLDPSFILYRKPGISSDGWRLRKALAKTWIEAIFPSINFISEMVRLVPSTQKPIVLTMAILLYLRNLIGPLRHRFALLRKKYINKIKNT